MRLRGFFLLAAALALLGASCDVPSGLLSDEERNSLYALEVSQGSRNLESGAALQPGSSLDLSLSTLSGAKNPDLLTLDLLDSSGATTATLSYASQSAAKAVQAPSPALSLPSLLGKLPSFSLPPGLAPGFYSLRSSLSSGGAEVQRSSIDFFVPSADWELGGVTFSPSLPRASGGVLLTASILATNPSLAPSPGSAERLWLRWSQGARVIAEGPLSEGFDRVVWSLPAAEGAYSIRLDFYPGPPRGSSYDLPSPWGQSLSFIAKPATPEKFSDPFSTPTRWASLFDFEGNIADSGSRPALSPPAVIGKPLLTAFPGGYGERLGPGAGFSVSKLGFSPADRGGAFSIALRLSLEGSSGLLFSLPLEGGGNLALGLEEGALWLDYPGNDDPAKRIRPSLSLGPGPHDLLLSFLPEKEGYQLVWSLDERGRERASLPAFEASFDTLLLGGEGSAAAVWDEFGLCYDETGGPPALLASSLFRQLGSRLLVATGFEGALGPDFTLSGAGGPDGLSLSLEDGSSLATARDLPTANGLQLTAALRSGSLRLELRKPDGSPYLSVGRDGELRDASGQGLGSLGEEGRRLQLSLSPVEGGLELRGPGGLALLVPGEPPQGLRAVLVAEGQLRLDALWISSLTEAKAGS